jgi:hypothetical protein
MSLTRLVCLSAFFITLFIISAETRNAKRDSNNPNSSSYLKAQGELALARYARAQIQRTVSQTLYESIIWPTSSNIAGELEKDNYTVVESLILENVTGRINPLGKFDNYKSTGEYFFALAGPLPGQSTTGKSRVTNIWFTQPITCWANSCWLRAIIGFSRFSDDVNSSNFTHMTVFNFDRSNRICSYEANFLGLERTGNLPENNTIRQASYLSTCNRIQTICTGNNVQYANASECLAFFNTIPYGGWGVADQNTVACRNLHVSLAVANPVTHCPHVGPTGGDKCIFHSAAIYYQDNLQGCIDPNW